ncbi:MAG: hypothetical protein J2P57_06600 [Acidimicrobiaceae bacterium]|nr:hypothetical protein [Acidimicrobiaceae bacterium]
MNGLWRRLAVVGSAIVIAQTFFAPDALAASPGGGGTSPLGGAGTAIPTSKCSTGGNSCFAGYAVAVPTGSHSASLTFVVSALTCGKIERSVLPSLILENSTGSKDVVGGVEETCLSGKATYTALVQAGSTLTSITKRVRARDKVTVIASVTSTNVAVKVKDVTAVWSKTVEEPRLVPAFADFGMDWVFNRNTGVVFGVPKFGKATFSNSLAGGKAIAKLTHTKFNRTISGTRDITTGPINSAGTGFVCTFVHA